MWVAKTSGSIDRYSAWDVHELESDRLLDRVKDNGNQILIKAMQQRMEKFEVFKQLVRAANSGFFFGKKALVMVLKDEDH